MSVTNSSNHHNQFFWARVLFGSASPSYSPTSGECVQSPSDSELSPLPSSRHHHSDFPSCTSFSSLWNPIDREGLGPKQLPFLLLRAIYSAVSTGWLFSSHPFSQSLLFIALPSRFQGFFDSIQCPYEGSRASLSLLSSEKRLQQISMDASCLPRIA